jgi:pimeloyl-ACP methyl ester carboxylesterase/GNAT superfamily N-acetyltransferase
LFVIRYDHRDQGLSSAVDFEKKPYTVADLALDALAILDAYDVKRAHVVGHSMGGTIVQYLAIHHPDRLLSFTSMSVGTVGEIGAPPKEVMDVLLENQPTQNFENDLSGFMRSWEVLNGDLQVDEQMAEAYTRDFYERSRHPVGVAWSHIKAQEGFGDLREELGSIDIPALFIHGEKDQLIPVDAGIETSKCVPGARCHVIPKMGHMIFSKEVEKQIATLLVRHIERSEFHIRQAKEADVPLILQFIRELAEYEKLLDEVVATEEILRETLFGKKQHAEVIIGEFRGVPVGFALFFHNFSTFLGRPGIYLEDLYVKPELRGKGFGKMLLKHLAKLCKERKCGRLEWWVLDWNKEAIKFYESIGAEAMDEWTVYRLTGDSLDQFAK